jgi:hypothetical protein
MPSPKAPPTVRVRYVGPLVEVDVPGLGLTGVKRLDVVEVPAQAAGRGPFWRPLEPDEPVLAYRQYRGDDGSGDPVQVWDLGSGLLAQVGNWEPVDAAAATPASESTAEPSTAESSTAGPSKAGKP